MEKPRTILKAILFSSFLAGCAVNPTADATPQRPQPNSGYYRPDLYPDPTPQSTQGSKDLETATPTPEPTETPWPRVTLVRTNEPTMTFGPSPTEIPTITPTPHPTSFARVDLPQPRTIRIIINDS